MSGGGERDDEVEELLDYLKRERGFDFTGYKRATLVRRIHKRREAVRAATLSEYLERLRQDRGEYARLFNTILINVTEFFRDDLPWATLERDIIPKLFARRSGQVRVWSAGCATGQEAYSLAMAMADAVGPDHFRERVKIYATDVDEEALAAARAGTYSEKEVDAVAPERVARYFAQRDGRFTFRKEFRRSIIFGRNDLVQDAPMSRIDLLVCRNTLMYFDADTQGRIVSRFHFALREGGFLFLGRGETLMSYTRLFEPVDLKRRIFIKLPRVKLGELSSSASRGGMDPDGPDASLARLLASAFHATASAQLVVDRTGDLVLANERAQLLFRLAPSDLGRPLQDLELSYRPLDLRSLLDQAYGEHRPILISDVEWRTDGEARWFDVCVTPLEKGGGEIAGASIGFIDATLPRRLQAQLVQSNMELETAYEELQFTNEELETTNEELQSTVEELETTNEELQATNAEMEAMNQELQVTNEQLYTKNDELRLSGDQRREVNEFLESIFTSLRSGVVVVDAKLAVTVWNAGAEEMWGLRSAEAHGKSLLNLDVGLPVERLELPLRAAVSGVEPVFDFRLPAINRRGRAISCRVVGNALVSPGATSTRGAILLMWADDGSPTSESQSEAASERIGAIR